MNASELRIGNYLQGALSPVVITKIFNKDNVGIGSGDPYNVTSEMPCLTPIPLTEGWLFKMGFKRNDSYGNFGDIAYTSNGFTLIKYSKGLYYCSASAIGVPQQYVHQLQNLYFALTGQELTVPETVNLN